MAILPTLLPPPLPEALQPWLMLNHEFHVLICHGASCQQALSPSAISRHLRDRHQVKKELRNQADQYLEQWQWPYNSHSVPLPPDGSAPQPEIPVVDGFRCQNCMFKTRNRKALREHANKEHGQKRVPDKEIMVAVRLQTWFGEKRERYWVVNETGPGVSKHCLGL